MASPVVSEEHVTQLRDVTGLSDEAARQLLQASNGSLEDAVALHFASEDDGAAAAHVLRTDGRGDAQEPSQAPRETQAPRLFTGEEGPGVLPVTTADRQQAAEDTAVRQEPATGGFLGSLGRMFSSVSQALLGVASEDFESFFSCRYGTPAPPFSKDCFGDAVKIALTEGRLLLVWFHSEDGPATDSFCRQVLQNGLVMDMIRQNYILWAGDVSRFEPGQIARLLGATTFPTVAVLQPLRHGFDHTFCLEWPLGTFAQPLFRLSPTSQGDSMNADQAIAALSSAAQDHHDAVQAREEQRTRREVQLADERHLRDEQDREFEESLLRDQLAAIAANEATSAENSAEAAAIEASSAAAVSSTAPTCPEASAAEKPDLGAAASATSAGTGAPSKVEATAADLKAEADAAALAAEEARVKRGAEILAQAEPEPAGNATAKILLKLSTGERMQRVFRAEQEMREVYEWVHCCRPTAKPLRFVLCTSFPAKTLSDRSATLRDMGLSPSAVVLLKEEVDD